MELDAFCFYSTILLSVVLSIALSLAAYVLLKHKNNPSISIKIVTIIIPFFIYIAPFLNDFK